MMQADLDSLINQSDIGKIWVEIFKSVSKEPAGQAYLLRTYIFICLCLQAYKSESKMGPSITYTVGRGSRYNDPRFIILAGIIKCQTFPFKHTLKINDEAWLYMFSLNQSYLCHRWERHSLLGAWSWVNGVVNSPVYQTGTLCHILPLVIEDNDAISVALESHSTQSEALVAIAFVHVNHAMTHFCQVPQLDIFWICVWIGRFTEFCRKFFTCHKSADTCKAKMFPVTYLMVHISTIS